MIGHEDDDAVPQFSQATVNEIFKLTQESSTRVNAPALHLSAEYLRLFATEALHRSCEAATKEKADKKGDGGGLVEVRHLEKITAGLLLDF